MVSRADVVCASGNTLREFTQSCLICSDPSSQCYSHFTGQANRTKSGGEFWSPSSYAFVLGTYSMPCGLLWLVLHYRQQVCGRTGNRSQALIPTPRSLSIFRYLIPLILYFFFLAKVLRNKIMLPPEIIFKIILMWSWTFFFQGLCAVWPYLRTNGLQK